VLSKPTPILSSILPIAVSASDTRFTKPALLSPTVVSNAPTFAFRPVEAVFKSLSTVVKRPSNPSKALLTVDATAAAFALSSTASKRASNEAYVSSFVVELCAALISLSSAAARPSTLLIRFGIIVDVAVSNEVSLLSAEPIRVSSSTKRAFRFARATFRLSNPRAVSISLEISSTSLCKEDICCATFLLSPAIG
jgi:hypothetical protein